MPHSTAAARRAKTSTTAQGIDVGALQRDSAHALYEQIADRLRDYIASHNQLGMQLQTDDALMQRYSVSRSTVRKAVQRLVDEGVLFRRRGKGTFVSQPVPKIVHSLDRLAPFFETFRQVGADLHTEVIDFFWEESPDLPPELDAWERPVFTFLRLYRSRGIPHALTRVRVPCEIGRHLSRADFESTPIYEVLQSKLGLQVTKADNLVSCQQPSASISRLLGLSQSSFLLVLDRISRDKSGAPIEMTTHFLRPDVYQLSVSLTTGVPHHKGP
ncbi:GntR family transcriptional regulator [Thiomonas sp.]